MLEPYISLQKNHNNSTRKPVVVPVVVSANRGDGLQMIRLPLETLADSVDEVGGHSSPLFPSWHSREKKAGWVFTVKVDVAEDGRGTIIG